jgi:ATP-dependent DNA helicase RecG
VRAFGGAAELSKAQLRSAPVHWPRPSVLDRPLSTLGGVGPKLSEAAAEAGLRTVADLLFYFPRDHLNREVVELASLEPGKKGTVLVEVQGGPPRPFRRGKLSFVGVKVGDRSGSVKATWFNQPWVAAKLVPGVAILMSGSLGKRGFTVAEYEFVAARPRVLASGEGGDLVPVHRLTGGLPAKRLRDWTSQACRLASNVVEGLPAELRARRGLAAVGDAIRAMHFPEAEADVEQARKRLVFEELFLHQAILLARQRAHRVAWPAPRLGKPGEAVGRWLDSLPFEPTGDQLAAFDEIDADIDSGAPMQRLLMGEVGSGKTVVALYTMLRALEAGFQAVLMAPTETLAEQHALTLNRLLGHEAIPFALLTGSTPGARRRETLERLATGELGLVVGTHALIKPEIDFARLGACVVDEQHRFGVRQRKALDSKGVRGMAPHILQMTATPIPRTLSLTAYGDLDTTALHQLPAGRRPVATRLIEEDDRPAAYEFIRGQLRAGRQAFVVCPLVAESEKLQGRAAEKEAAVLAVGEFADFSVGVLHGQMHSAAKAAAMEAFVSGATDVLVATTVIEVGIDVANATVMVIEGAERYGISQLHQLRGRVGRGEHESICLLFPGEAGEGARKRLQAVAGESDGFKLAEVDLVLRGAGEILGTRQHGLPRFAVAELPDDTPTLVAARDEVVALLERHGSLEDAALGPLLRAARSRFGADASDPIPL